MKAVMNSSFRGPPLKGSKKRFLDWPKISTQWANLLVGFGDPIPLGRVVATPIVPPRVAQKSKLSIIKVRFLFSLHLSIYNSLLRYELPYKIQSNWHKISELLEPKICALILACTPFLAKFRHVIQTRFNYMFSAIHNSIYVKMFNLCASPSKIEQNWI